MCGQAWQGEACGTQAALKRLPVPCIARHALELQQGCALRPAQQGQRAKAAAAARGPAETLDGGSWHAQVQLAKVATAALARAGASGGGGSGATDSDASGSPPASPSKRPLLGGPPR